LRSQQKFGRSVPVLGLEPLDAAKRQQIYRSALEAIQSVKSR